MNNNNNGDDVHSDIPAYDGANTVLAVLAQPPFRGIADTTSTEGSTRYLLRGRHNGLTEGSSSSSSNTAHPESFEYFDLPLIDIASLIGEKNEGAEEHDTFPSSSHLTDNRVRRRVAIPVEPYHRSAAGKALDADTLRTPLALEKSMHFLVEHYMRAPHTALVFTDPFKVWGYLWDRFRGIRTTWIPQLPPCGSDGVGYVEADTTTTTTSTSSPTNAFSSTSNKGQKLRYLSPEVLQREGRHRVRWLEFTVAALAIGAAYLCRTTTGCRRFVIEKKNFLESMSQCFTDLAVMYRQERRLRNAEYVSLLLLLYGLRQESKAEDRALFCVFTSQYINNIATLCPELPAASVNLSQVYKELEKQPAMLATQPVRIALELLHCWATRNWFRFFYLCRTGKLSFVQRAVLFQSFTYARFRAVLDLVLPNRFVYTKLRMRHDIRISELAELLLMDETHCYEFLCAMGLARSIDRTHRLLRLSDAKSEGFITAEEIEAQCADKQKLFFPTAPSFFGFRVWREAFVRFPHTDFFQHGGTNDMTLKEEEEIVEGGGDAIQDEHDEMDEAVQGENDEGEVRQTSAPHNTLSNPHSINEKEEEEAADEEEEYNNDNMDFNEEREEEGDAYYDYRDNSLVGTASQPSAQAEEDEVNDSERALSQQQNNDEDTNEDIQLKATISNVGDDDEDHLLRLPGCPINLMEILEPYCPAYQGEVKRLVLCDVAEELFASIPKHRAAMLRVALQRGPHRGKAQLTVKEEEEQENVDRSASESESRVTASSVFSDHEHHIGAAKTTEHVREEERAGIDDETQAEHEEDISSMNETMRAAQALTSALAQDPLYREAMQRRQEQSAQLATKAEEEKAEASVKDENEDKESTERDASQATSEEQHAVEEEQQPATTTTTTTIGNNMKGVTITAVLSAQSSPALPSTPNNTTQAHSILVTRSPIVESPLSTPQLPITLLPSKEVQRDTAQPALSSNTTATAAIAAHPWHTIDNKEDNDVEDVEPITTSTTIASDSKSSGSDEEEEEQRPLAWDEAPSPTLPHDFARKLQAAPQIHTTEKAQEGTRKDNPVNIDLTESLPTESSLSSSSPTTENKDVEHAEEEEEAESTRISSLSTESDVETSVQRHTSPERSTSTRSSRGSSSSSHHEETLLPTIFDKQQQLEHHNALHKQAHHVHDPLRSPSPVSSLSAPSVTNGPAVSLVAQEQGSNGTAGARVHERKQEEEERHTDERLLKLPTTTTSAGRRKSRSTWTAEARRVCFRRLRDKEETTMDSHKRPRGTCSEEKLYTLARQGVVQSCVGLFEVAEEHLQAVWRTLFVSSSNITSATATSTVKQHAVQNALRFALLNAEMSEGDCKAWMSALAEAIHTEHNAKSKKTASRRNMTSAGQGSMAAELYKRARLARRLCCGFTMARVSLAEAIIQRAAEQMQYYSVSSDNTASMTQSLQDCLDTIIGTFTDESTVNDDWQSTAVRMGQYIGQRFAQAQLKMMSRNTHTDEDNDVVSSARKTHEKKCEQILVEDEQGRLTALLVSRPSRREHYTIKAASQGVAMVHNKADYVKDMTWLLKRRILQFQATFVLVSASEEEDDEGQNNTSSECAARLFELDVIQALAHNTQGANDTLYYQKPNDEYSSTKEMPVRLAVRHVVHKGITTSLPSPSSRTSSEMFTTCVSLYQCETSALTHIQSSLVHDASRMSFSYDAQTNTIHAGPNNISSSNEDARTARSFPCITSIACITLDEEAGTLAKSSLATLRAIVAQGVKAGQERDMHALRVTGVLLFMCVEDEEEEEQEDVIAEQQRFIEQTFWDLWHDSTRSNSIRGDKESPCSTSSESDEEAAANTHTHTTTSSPSFASSSAGNRLTHGLWRGHRLLHRPEKLKRLEASKTDRQCYAMSGTLNDNSPQIEVSSALYKAIDKKYYESDAPVLVVMPVMKSRVAECVEAGLRALLEAYRTNVETCHE